MKAIYHYVLDYNKDYATYLDEHGISFEWHHSEAYSKLIFDIEEDNNCCPEILQMAKEPFYFRYLEYSQKDLLEAELLTMRARNLSLDLAREDRIFAFSEQQDDGSYNHRMLATNHFYIKKPVKWGKKHFVAANVLGESHLFCDDYAAGFLSKYTGVNLLPVFHYRTENVMDNTHYVDFKTIIPNEMICFEKQQKFVCPNCGQETWMIGPDHQLSLRKEYDFKDISFAKTLDIWGGGYHYRHPINVVSHMVYVRMLEEGMVRNVVFEPVFLI